MINAIAKGIFDILIADAPLVAALGGTAGNGYKIYRIIAPQKAAFPYITFDLLTGAPEGTFADARAVDETTWWFNVFGEGETGSKAVGDIVALMTDVLDGASLTVTGYSFMKCVYEFMGSVIYDPDTEIYQIPLRYRVWVDKL